MAMQKKAWMTSFLFKEFLTFFKKFVPGGVTFVSFGWEWQSCYFRNNKTCTRV
jgi:hypothetical protein